MRIGYIRPQIRRSNTTRAECSRI